MSLAACILGFFGFGCLALSMPKHWRAVFARGLAKPLKLTLRGAGWTLLAAALIPCVARWDAAVGVVAWLGILTVAALSVATLLTYGPRVPSPRLLEEKL